MYTLNAPLASLKPGLPRQALGEIGSRATRPIPSEWDLLSRELMVMLQEPASRQNDQIERWEKLSRAIHDFVETMKQSSDWRSDAGDRKVAVRFARLTARQRQVMELVVQGRANKMIAYLLNISVRTVENHRATIMKKTGVRTLPDLVRVAMMANIPSGTADNA